MQNENETGPRNLVPKLEIDLKKASLEWEGMAWPVAIEDRKGTLTQYQHSREVWEALTPIIQKAAHRLTVHVDTRNSNMLVPGVVYTELVFDSRLLPQDVDDLQLMEDPLNILVEEHVEFPYCPIIIGAPEGKPRPVAVTCEKHRECYLGRVVPGQVFDEGIKLEDILDGKEDLGIEIKNKNKISLSFSDYLQKNRVVLFAVKKNDLGYIKLEEAARQIENFFLRLQGKIKCILFNHHPSAMRLAHLYNVNIQTVKAGQDSLVAAVGMLNVLLTSSEAYRQALHRMRRM